MTKTEIIAKTKDLEESLRGAHSIDQNFYNELLEEYELHMLTLKSVGDSYPWEQAIIIQEKHDKMSQLLGQAPLGMSNDDFEEYIILGDLLAVLLN